MLDSLQKKEKKRKNIYLGPKRQYETVIWANFMLLHGDIVARNLSANNCQKSKINRKERRNIQLEGAQSTLCHSSLSHPSLLLSLLKCASIC